MANRAELEDSGRVPRGVISVRHRLGEYCVEFGGLREALQALPERAFAITDDNVAEAWGHVLPEGWRVLAVPPGEKSKSLDRYSACLEWLAEQSADRQSTLVAFGGGVVGDLAGFVASSYMRGIRYVQVPTTLLAQVDSSVGGKVAVDLPQGKNLAGAFYPPERVLICTETLRTLPWREFANGMAEVWKYGFIADAELVRALRHLRLAPDSGMIESIVRRCIQIKAAIVEQDELDTTGLRAVLNFGHTVGHALELLAGFEGLLHGEAIAVGMVAEAKIGEHIGITEKGTADDVKACLELDGLPTFDERTKDLRLIDAMQSDKKAESGELAFSLLTKVGECKLVRAVPRQDIEAALRAL